MPIRVTPVVPSEITVHLGLPDEEAENITVSFPDYVKNVASSEIYPTWEPAAIEANILAIVSFALNRVYTEFYPSRGYDFDITSTTAYDQKFIRGRNTTSAVWTLWSLWRPSSATAPPAPVTDSPSGAARTWPSGDMDRWRS